MEPVTKHQIPPTIRRPADHLPLIVICGPTASGKSELAMKVAKRFNGEIICADSRTVYKGMDIGTAKPTKRDQQKVKHHLLDVVQLNERFTVYDFQQQAQAAIQNIRSRGRLPVLVGGTGLYIDSIIFNYRFPKKISQTRHTLDRLSVEELRDYCRSHAINLPQNEKNKRHLITAIGHNNVTPKARKTPISNTIVVGITTNLDELEDRIAKRAEYIFSHGVVEEAKTLGEIYGWDNEPMSANIYRIIRRLLNKEFTLEAATAKSITLDRQLARRQLTWLKRNSHIEWYSLVEAESFLFNTLAK